MLKLKSAIIMFAIILVFSACATTYKYGKEFPVNNVNQIRIGITSQQDVLDLFGEPLKKGIINGNDIFIYTKENIIFNGDDVEKKGDNLVIEFDEKGIVKNYYLNVPGKDTSVMSFVLYKKYRDKQEELKKESSYSAAE